jgi:hypothetical protein
MFSRVIFRRVRKFAKSDYYLRYVCPFAWNNSAPIGPIFMKCNIWVFFENMSRKFKCNESPIRISGNIQENHYTFLIITLSLLLRRKNISHKCCRENYNTHFMFNNFFVENNMVEPQSTSDYLKQNTRIACWISKDYKHTLRISNYDHSSATAV